MTQKRFGAWLAMMLAVSGLLPAIASAEPAEIKLFRLDCGGFQNVDMTLMSDDDRYLGQRHDSSNGCYLIQHGTQYMLWDAGLLVGTKVEFRGGWVLGPARSVKAQLAEIGVAPQQIQYVGISHWHPDHTAQLSDFPQAKLLIGKQDWPLKAFPGWTGGFDVWLKDESKVEKLEHDKDVFGDGSVMILATPGHTAGHHSLMVHLGKARTVMLTGDLYGSRESYDHDVVPAENVDRADTLASFDRFKKLVARYKAQVIVQHEPTDIARLPAFPKGAQ